MYCCLTYSLHAYVPFVKRIILDTWGGLLTQKVLQYDLYLYGGRSSVWLERWIVAPEAVGSSPIVRPK